MKSKKRKYRLEENNEKTYSLGRSMIIWDDEKQDYIEINDEDEDLDMKIMRIIEENENN